MDHHQQHHEKHRKEREAEKKREKLYEQEQDRERVSFQPVWYVAGGALLVLFAVLVWIFVWPGAF
jgi:hypothetical protein